MRRTGGTAVSKLLGEFPSFHGDRPRCAGNGSLVFRLLSARRVEIVIENRAPDLHSTWESNVQRERQRQGRKERGREKAGEKIVPRRRKEDKNFSARRRNETKLKCGADAKRLDSHARAENPRRNLETAEISTHPMQVADIFTRCPGYRRARSIFSPFFFTIARSPEFFMAPAFTYRNIPRSTRPNWAEITLARASKFRAPQAVTMRGYVTRACNYFFPEWPRSRQVGSFVPSRFRRGYIRISSFSLLLRHRNVYVETCEARRLECDRVQYT